MKGDKLTGNTNDHENRREERLQTFIESLEVGNTPFLNQLEKKALQDRVPVIRPGTQSLLKFLLELNRPSRILEVGAAVGFSAIFMGTVAPLTEIITIEKDHERAEQAEKNIEEAGFESRITLLEGDAAEILERLAESGESFDMLFMDAAKGQYMHFLPAVEKLVRPGGILLSDNILQEGDILESKFAVTRRNRTIHRRMREYLFELTHSTKWQTVVLETGDGAAISVRKED